LIKFKARDADEREKWVRRLEDTILRHASRRAIWDQQQPPNNSISHGTPSSNSNNKRNHLLLFDRKVGEADAYLQLMIEQTTVIILKLGTLRWFALF
jgi:oxysterol-binding protein-related protein 9/10/11